MKFAIIAAAFAAVAVAAPIAVADADAEAQRGGYVSSRSIPRCYEC